MNSTISKASFTILLLLQFSAALSTCATQVEAAGSVEILSNTGYLDSSGNYNVVGEVQNVGSQAVNFIQVTATFYDSHDTVVDSRFDLTMLYVLLNGRKSPFEIALLDVAESSRVSRYSLAVTYLETSPLPMKLEILSHTNQTDAEGNMHIVGNLRNNGDEKLVNAKVVATYYDVSWHVVAAALIGFDPELTGDINPNQIVPFEIILDKARAQYVQTCALAAESNQYAMIPEFPTAIMYLILMVSLFAVAIDTRTRAHNNSLILSTLFFCDSMPVHSSLPKCCHAYFRTLWNTILLRIVNPMEDIILPFIVREVP